MKGVAPHRGCCEFQFAKGGILFCFVFWRFVIAFFSPFGLGFSLEYPINDITPVITPYSLLRISRACSRVHLVLLELSSIICPSQVLYLS